MSIVEEAKRSNDPERHDTGHLSDLSLDTTNYDDDPNFDLTTAYSVEDDSPYPEVRSAVANTDDPTMPASTLRAWFLGLIWAVFLPSINQIFNFRNPPLSITEVIPLLVSFPIGKLWALYVPNVTLFGIELNPGPFTIKEHVLITIMAGVGQGAPYASFIVSVQKVFYNQSPSFTYQWLLMVSTQLIGFSIGGICKRILVYPPSMIWPYVLVSASMFNTMHSLETTSVQGLGGISRGLFFTYVFIGYFFYNFLPNYLFTALSSFSWVCWIAPDNVKLNQLFGVTHGLGMGVITFDWGQISGFNGSPLPNPWWSAANVGIALLFFSWFLVPVLYYTNTWYSAFLPMFSSQAFDNTGSPYNVSRVINDDVTFNIDAYKAYSPLFIPTPFAVTYGLSFATTASIFTHFFIYYRKPIYKQARCSLAEQPDVHARLMSVYKEVPNWWYLAIFFTTFGFGVAVIEIWHSEFPVWAFILALIVAFVYTIPCGIILAITNWLVGNNVIAELIVGYLLPGRPIAVMLFKTWAVVSLGQTLDFIGYFKLGHYMKIPPRPMFLCQVVASIVAATAQFAVQAWLFSNVEDICSPTQKDGFTCPSTITFGNASIIWGLIGPQRLFSHGQLYYGLVFSLLVGAVLPIIQRILHKRFMVKGLRYLNLPLLFAAVSVMPPATPINFVPWVVTCFLFNYVIRRRYFNWWSKYHYILSAALDASYSISMVVIYLTLQYPENGRIGLNSIQTWWGNTVYTKTADFKGTPFNTLAEGQKFGPKSW